MDTQHPGCDLNPLGPDLCFSLVIVQSFIACPSRGNLRESVIKSNWSLLLSSDPDIVGSDTASLVVASVKAQRQTMEMISTDINASVTDTRINAVYRLQVLWKNRYQVWPRLEENGQINMKVTPNQIEFTLPSPKIGIENLPVVDPPWMHKLKQN